jgi:hypothetical protein
MISIPLEDIYPLLKEFVATYRGLMLLAMVNAFDWASAPPHLPSCAAAKPGKILYITLSAVPNISPATKAKSAFRVENAEAITFESFRDAVTNRQHPLYETENQQLIDGYDDHVAQMRNHQGSIHRNSMCILKLHFNNGVRAFMYFANWYYTDDPMRNYSAQWNPVNWLEYLKRMVARGKGWHRNDVNFN